MSLQQWVSNGWLRPHQTSPKEIQDLLAIVRRDLADATGNISADWQFGIAYNAALKLCTVLLYASGYRPEKTLQHYRTLQALPLILGPERKADADYLDACRIKRNTVEYDYAGAATRNDVGRARRRTPGGLARSVPAADSVASRTTPLREQNPAARRWPLVSLVPKLKAAMHTKHRHNPINASGLCMESSQPPWFQRQQLRLIVHSQRNTRTLKCTKTNSNRWF